MEHLFSIVRPPVWTIYSYILLCIPWVMYVYMSLWDYLFISITFSIYLSNYEHVVCFLCRKKRKMSKISTLLRVPPSRPVSSRALLVIIFVRTIKDFALWVWKLIFSYDVWSGQLKRKLKTGNFELIGRVHGARRLLANVLWLVISLKYNRLYKYVC